MGFARMAQGLLFLNEPAIHNLPIEGDPTGGYLSSRTSGVSAVSMAASVMLGPTCKMVLELHLKLPAAQPPGELGFAPQSGDVGEQPVLNQEVGDASAAKLVIGVVTDGANQAVVTLALRYCR